VARFDVYRYANKAAPLLVDVQADLLSDLASRVVVPLALAGKAGKEELPRLKPKIDIDGKAYILMTTDIGVVPVASLGKLAGNIENEHRYIITAALDFLFQGF
jgi:toxin CcdB